MKLWCGIVALLGGSLSPALAQSIADRAALVAGLEIRGTVTVYAANAGSMPVQGVEIKLSELSADHAQPPVVIATILSDSSGAFQFHPTRLGQFVVNATKDGYQSVGSDPVASRKVELTRETPKQSVEFHFSRAGGIGGRVINESNRPITGLKLELSQEDGFPTGYYTTTDSNGVFHMDAVLPGRYLVHAVPRASYPEEVRAFRDEDLAVVDEDIETSYWPGDFEGVPKPVVVRAGEIADVGSIRLSTVPYYRAHFQVRSDECDEGEGWYFQAIPIHPSAGRNVPVPSLLLPCATVKKRGFLIRNLRAGSYVFSLTARANGRELTWASEAIEIRRENISVEMTMIADSAVTGTVIAAEGAAPPNLKNVRVSSHTLVGGQNGGETSPLDSAGSFSMRLPWQQQQLLVDTGATNSYVQQIRLNGQPVADGVLGLRGAPAQLEVVIDDKAASVQATVMDGDKLRADAQVMMVKWPIPPELPDIVLFSQYRLFPGRGAMIGSLPPGEYRIFALPDGSDEVLKKAGMLVRLAEQGQKLVLEQGSSQNVVVKLTDLSRF